MPLRLLVLLLLMFPAALPKPIPPTVSAAVTGTPVSPPGSIDPTAVALASSPPVAGQSATIQVTPRSNSYGTISYLYQYSIDDGSTWTTIATSSATSYSFTVPTGAASIKVRVRAQDNLGFTSADYVTSSAYTVTQSTTYAGVSGAVRSVTDYAGVSGAVRSVTTYKGVGGTVRS